MYSPQRVYQGTSPKASNSRLKPVRILRSTKSEQLPSFCKIQPSFERIVGAIQAQYQLKTITHYGPPSPNWRGGKGVRWSRPGQLLSDILATRCFLLPY